MEPVRVIIQHKDLTSTEQRMANDEAVKMIDDLFVNVNIKDELTFRIHEENYESTALMGVIFEEVIFHGSLGTIGVSFEHM